MKKDAVIKVLVLAVTCATPFLIKYNLNASAIADGIPEAVGAVCALVAALAGMFHTAPADKKKLKAADAIIAASVPPGPPS